MTDTGDKRPTSSTGHRFSDDIKQLAYEIWISEGGRSATRTHLLLAEECRREAKEAIDPDSGEILSIDHDSIPIPTVRQVQRWVKDGNWEQRADDDIARLAPKLYKRFNTMLFTTVPFAQRWDFNFLVDVCTRPNLTAGMQAICEKVSGRVQTSAGVGTAAGLMPVTMPQSAPEALAEGLTPQEMARVQRERLRELRDGR